MLMRLRLLMSDLLPSSDLAVFRDWLASRAPVATLAEQRERFEAEHAAIPLPPGCRIDRLLADRVEIEQVIPQGARLDRALVYLHGGGHMFGSIASHRHLVARLAAAAGVTAFSVGYRLAPEHPYPAGLEDAREAFEFLLAQGFRPADLVIGGESAGGNLAAALTLSLRCARIRPAGLLLISPWLDLACGGASMTSAAATDLLISREALLACAQAYLGDTSPKSPLASPLRAKELTGFPPILAQASADEVLLSDSVDFVAKAAGAGVAADLQLRPGVVHAWPLFHPHFRAGREAIVDAGRWIADRLKEPQS